MSHKVCRTFRNVLHTFCARFAHILCVSHWVCHTFCARFAHISQGHRSVNPRHGAAAYRGTDMQMDTHRYTQIPRGYAQISASDGVFTGQARTRERENAAHPAEPKRENARTRPTQPGQNARTRERSPPNRAKTRERENASTLWATRNARCSAPGLSCYILIDLRDGMLNFHGGHSGHRSQNAHSAQTRQNGSTCARDGAGLRRRGRGVQGVLFIAEYSHRHT